MSGSKCIVCSKDSRFQNLEDKRFQLCERCYIMQEDEPGLFLTLLNLSFRKNDARLTELNLKKQELTELIEIHLKLHGE